MENSPKKKNRYVLFRHRIWFAFFRFFLRIHACLFLGYRYEEYALKKGENVLILSNHQTDFDPILISLSVKKPIYFLATDTLLSNGWISRLIEHTVAPVPKKKGTSDLQSVVSMMRIAKEGGNLCFFPEGNRTYAEFQFDISLATVKFIKKFGLPVLLFNFHGGTGVLPRFADKKRKGPFTGKVTRRLEPEEYRTMPDEELQQLILDGLRVYDSDSGNRYRSKNRAQYLENMLFLCPECKAVSSLVSEGNFIRCTCCGHKTEYTEDLHLVPDHPEPDFHRLIDWYNYQKKWVSELCPEPGKTIFSDKDVRIYELELYKKRRLVAESELILNETEMKCGDMHFPVSEIDTASPIGGRKLSFTCGEKSYLAIASERFNPLKYVLVLNRLDSGIKRCGYDRNFVV